MNNPPTPQRRWLHLILHTFLHTIDVSVGDLLALLAGFFEGGGVAQWVIAEYLCHKWPRLYSVFRNHNSAFPHSWLITGFVTRRVPHVEQELLFYEPKPLLLEKKMPTLTRVWVTVVVIKKVIFLNFIHSQIHLIFVTHNLLYVY